jgi:hypothetical protein
MSSSEFLGEFLGELSSATSIGFAYGLSLDARLLLLAGLLSVDDLASDPEPALSYVRSPSSFLCQLCQNRPFFRGGSFGGGAGGFCSVLPRLVL